jgi:hypothetical protein
VRRAYRGTSPGGRRIISVGGGRLARLCQARAERGLAPVERAGQAIGHVVGQGRPRHDEAPRAHRVQLRGLARVGAGRHHHQLEERVLALDAPDAVEIRHQEAPARRPPRHRGEARPADASAPERGHPPVHHHGGAVARRVEEHGLEVAVAGEPEAVEDVPREDDQPRAARPEGDRSALEVLDRSVGRVGPHHEHAGRGVHRGEDAQVRGRAADAGPRLVGDLALHQGQVERARLEQRHVLGGALGVARAHLERRVRLVDGVGHRLAVYREAAAGGGGAERHGGAARGRRALAHAAYGSTGGIACAGRPSIGGLHCTAGEGHDPRLETAMRGEDR